MGMEMRRQNLNRLKERANLRTEVSKEGMMMGLNRLSGNKLVQEVEVVELERGLGLQDEVGVEEGAGLVALALETGMELGMDLGLKRK